MPVSQNPKECGWFYHAPARKQVGIDRVEAPAPSQIPGIGYDAQDGGDKEEVREMTFKETDSKYIRLAKMGGRKDLLAFDPDRYTRKTSAGSRGYQRSDWYYLEDNRMQDEEKKAAENQEWEFLLPEYMVHKGYKPSFENPATPPTRGGVPYYTDAATIGETQGRSATDKTVKIPELRKPGYGVRNERSPAAMMKLPPREKLIRPQESELAQGSRRKQAFSMPSEKDDPTNMMKLLTGEYEREWYQKLGDTQSHENAHKSATMGMHGNHKGPEENTKCGRIGSGRNPGHLKKSQDAEEKEMFKLARFKNISSKVDSHQKPEIMAATK